MAHQEWIGYVQPVGLVVSIPALLQAQAVVDRNIIPLHQKFMAAISESNNPAIVDFPDFTQTVLDWQRTDLLGGADAPPVPAELEVTLPEYNEALRPTWVVVDPAPADATRPWLILIQELALGTDFDAISTTDDRHWQASPQARMERLLRETQIPIGLLVNGAQVRLVYAPRGENSGHATFKVSEMATVAGRPMFAALHMLLNADRLFSAAPDRRLTALLANSRKYQSLVSNQLAEQVLAALYELLRGLQAADDARKGDLLRDVLAEDPNQVYNSLLTVLMRLVFLLYAEDRDLLSTDPVYVNHYSITGLFDRLRADAGRFPDTMDQRFGAWAQLLTLFRLVYDGGGHGNLHLPAREGYLFDPDRYPFLEGRAWKTRREPGHRLNIPRVPDGVVFRVLQNLLILDGERLSYRTLDVEQIGSVYEKMMGFNLQVAQGKSIAIKPTKSHGAPAAINLEELLATKPADRAKWLTWRTDQKLTGQSAEALKTAESIEDLLASLEKKIARTAMPNVVPKGAMVFQPSDERRKSGSHYTPRSLTEPIVRKTLEPILKRLGDHPTPGEILNLKVCDLAMGSGAFLVEACRHLGDKLVHSWHHHKALPKIPPDEDEVLHARRLIAQRCLYGVDKNSMAVDLAKLSLWLATLAKDHPFTFLDHSLRHGDSLVGLTAQQIQDFHWLPVTQKQLGQQHVENAVQQATAYRKRILDAADGMPPAVKRAELSQADGHLDAVRFYGDLVIAAFFAGENEKQRKAKRDELLDRLLDAIRRLDVAASPHEAVMKLRTGAHPVVPFHWQIEFPEVFLEGHGFDAIIGNPPFAGGAQVSEMFGGPRYQEWLKVCHEDAFGNADLSAYFFRQAHTLVSTQGTCGLLATKTISEGETRTTGLKAILARGGWIYDAVRSQKWPGEASVLFVVVHFSTSRNTITVRPVLDGKEVDCINSRLYASDEIADPEPLASNNLLGFMGVALGSSGFVLEVNEYQRLADNPANHACLLPYLGGEEVNTSPAQSHERYAICFGSESLDYAEQFPELLDMVRVRVKPGRERALDHGPGKHGKKYWWQFTLRRDPLYESIAALPRCLVTARTTAHLAFTFQPIRQVFAESLLVFAFADFASFACLQAQAHSHWARLLSSYMGQTLRYSVSEAFQTYPLPLHFQTDPRLEAAGKLCYEFRAQLMLRNNEGLTTTYNRFHDPEEQSEEIKRLRELHNAMDRAVLDAYGWRDIQPSCEFPLDYEEDEDEEAELGASRRSRKKPWRYRWPDDIRDEVLARLLALNQQRAEEEGHAAGGTDTDGASKRKGKSPAKPGKSKKKDVPGQLTMEKGGFA